MQNFKFIPYYNATTWTLFQLQTSDWNKITLLNTENIFILLFFLVRNINMYTYLEAYSLINVKLIVLLSYQ